MWMVVNRNHPAGCKPYFVEDSMGYTRRGAIKKFCQDTTRPWRYWYRKYNFRCEKVHVTFSTTEP